MICTTSDGYLQHVIVHDDVIQVLYLIHTHIRNTMYDLAQNTPICPYTYTHTSQPNLYLLLKYV